MPNYSIHTALQSVPGLIFPFLFVLLAGAFSCFITYNLWSNAQLSASKALQSEFDFRVRETSEHIVQRMDTYRQVLRGALGLMHGSIDIGRERFRSYITTLRLDEQYPGIQGIAISEIVPEEKLDEHVLSIRHQGFPDYSILDTTSRTQGSLYLYYPHRALQYDESKGIWV